MATTTPLSASQISTLRKVISSGNTAAAIATLQKSTPTSTTSQAQVNTAIKYLQTNAGLPTTTGTSSSTLTPTKTTTTTGGAPSSSPISTSNLSTLQKVVSTGNSSNINTAISRLESQKATSSPTTQEEINASISYLKGSLPTSTGKSSTPTGISSTGTSSTGTSSTGTSSTGTSSTGTSSTGKSSTPTGTSSTPTGTSSTGTSSTGTSTTGTSSTPTLTTAQKLAAFKAQTSANQTISDTSKSYLDNIISSGKTSQALSTLGDKLKSGAITQSQFNLYNSYLQKNKPTTEEKTSTSTLTFNDKNKAYLDKIISSGKEKEAQTLLDLKLKDGKITQEQYDKLSGYLNTGTTGKEMTNIGKDELTKTEEEVNKDKITAAQEAKNIGIENVNAEFNKGVAVLNENNENLLNLYGINKDGSIDMENTNGFAYQMEKLRQDYEKSKNESLAGYTSARLNQVRGSMKAKLLARGVDISKIPPEQLIDLSDDVGATAFSDIFKAKEQTVNDIQTNTENMITKINYLREKGMISTNEATANIEKLRAAYENQKLALQKEYTNTVFGITTTAQSQAETDKTNAINTMTATAKSLGLTGTGLASISSYLTKYTDAEEGLTAMIKDLNDKNSVLYKAVNDIEKASLAAAQAEYALKLAQASKSSSGYKSGFSTTTRRIAASLWNAKNKTNPVTENGITDQQVLYIQSTPEYTQAINNGNTSLQ